MLTLLEIIKKTTEFLAQKGVESPRLNAELLIGHVLGLKRMQLYMQFERPLAEAELDKIRPLVRRRGQREPLQYIVGMTEFCGLVLKTDRRALIPRPETERLIELLVERLTVPPLRILDLGTGTGAIALALAQKYPDARITAVDRDRAALELAAENAQATGVNERVTLIESDWFNALPPESRFDLIVANPPYLTRAEVAEAAPEVRDYEPHAALAAGEEGLDDLMKIFRTAPAFLAEPGLLAMETGVAQHAGLQALGTEGGFTQIESLPDLTGRDRFVFARR